MGWAASPTRAIVAGAVAPTRTWNDANRDFIPQCDLTNLLANGECAQASNLAFGSAVPTEQFDKDLITGFNHRQTNWETSVSMVHELMPRVGIDVGYFRRVVGQLPRDRQPGASRPPTSRSYDIVNPVDPRLGDDSGATVRGFVDVVPTKFGQVNNYNTLSTKDRRSDRGVAGRGLHRQRPAAERAEPTRRRQHRLDARERLRHPDGAAGDAQHGGDRRRQPAGLAASACSTATASRRI